MARIKVDLELVTNVRQYADRSLDIECVDPVRGPITVRLRESEARWLFASMADIVRGWHQADGESE